MLRYLVTYDISCNKRRKKVSDLLEGYGQRVQYSVFECVLTADQYAELRQRLKPRVRESEDSVRLYPLSRHTLNQVEIWGGVPLVEPPGSIVV
jgi:CRISPR-associated protein Cas2